jgi:exodeoxyribonuclease-3
MYALLYSGFVDVFRVLHPNEVVYTYWSYRTKGRARNVGWRIDYFLISSSLVDKVTSIKAASEFYESDHCPIILEINT